MSDDTNDDTWTEPAALAWAPAFHSDPCPGGPPLFTADGHWWWSGETWVPLHLPESA